MYRVSLAVVGAVSLAAFALAQVQKPIQWISNVEQGVAKAKRSGLPIMFYVAGSSRGDEGDLDDAQQRAFRDPLVRGMAEQRFVAIRLARSNATASLLEEMGVSGAGEAGAQGGGNRGARGRSDRAARFGMYIVCATPDGKLIGVIPPGQVAEQRVLARQLTAMFRKYRVGVFERDLKPTLEDEAARPADLMKALKKIDKFLITEADDSVVKLLERGQLGSTVEKQVYNVLAVLSTPRSVKSLLEAAPRDKLAAAALARCTPAGAEVMWSASKGGEMEQFVAAYTAVTKICKIRDAKPRGFWGGPRQQLIDAEIERVTQEVERRAKRWRETYEEYR